MSLRRAKLNAWLFGILNTKGFCLEELAGDASPREYLRLTISNNNFIVMLARADASLQAFIKISQFFVANNITAPKIYHIDLDNGFLLLQDFGDALLLKVLQNADNRNSALHEYYTQAIDSLILMQQLSNKANKLISGNFTKHYLLDSLEIFKIWYLNKYLQIKLNNNQLDLILNNLVEKLLILDQELPQVLVHVDYHSRNILLLPNGGLGILDFQDAMFGPATYDVLSLLQDAYIVCPEVIVTELLNYYITQAIIGGILPNNIDKDKMHTSFYLCALHRHLKNLGVFARLAVRDHNTNYMPHIPTLIKYILNICDKFPEFNHLKQFFNEIAVIECSN